MNSKITLLIVLFVGITSFLIGEQYQKSKTSRLLQTKKQGNYFHRISNQNMVTVTGKIIEVDKNSFSLKIKNDSSEIILLTNDTNIEKNITASKEDLKTEEQVRVTGSVNNNKTIIAKYIQISDNFTQKLPVNK